MTLWLNDIEEGSIVSLPITTHVAAGANVAPSSAFEIDDIRVYRGASATQRSSTAGMSIVSPFDSLTGVHMLEIDCSDNTDAGFWAAGNMYHVMLVPDETVDGQAIAVHVGSFGISHGLVAALAASLATILSRMGTPSNLGGGATISANLSDIEGQTDDIGVAGAGLTAITNRLPAALVSGRMDASVGAMAADVVTAAAVATGAIDADAIADNAIDAGAIATGAITAAKFAAGAIDAGAIATGAIDADALAADVIADIFQGTALTQSYATDGAAATPAQLLYMIWAMLAEKSVSGTTLTVKKLDGSTTAMTFTLNSATDPTSITRAS